MGRTKKRTNPGFKTLVDRLRSALLDLSRDWVWRKEDLRGYLKWKAEGFPTWRGCVPYFGYNFGKKDRSNLWYLSKVRKMKAELKKQGLYEKALESLGPWKFREQYKYPW
jgi:hypothetical protein